MAGKLSLKRGRLVRTSERIAVKNSFSRFTNNADTPIIIDEEVIENIAPIGQNSNAVTEIKNTTVCTSECKTKRYKKRTTDNEGILSYSNEETVSKREKKRSKCNEKEQPINSPMVHTRSQQKRASVDRIQKGCKQQKTVNTVNTKNLVGEFPKLRTRSSPHSLCKGLQNLSPTQKKTIIKWGFKRLIRFNVVSIPSCLAYHVIQSFDSDSMRMKVGTRFVKITKDAIHNLTGLPAKGTKITKTKEWKEGRDVNNAWLTVHGDVKQVSAALIADRLATYDNVDWMFKLDFVMLFITSMIECRKTGKCMTSYLPFFKENIDVGSLDWCDLIYRSLKDCKRKWEQQNSKEYFVGPLTILTLLYVDETAGQSEKVKGRKTTLEQCNYRKLKTQEAREINMRGFKKGGIGKIAKQ